MSDTKLREKADALIAFTQQGPRFIAWVQAVTDALAPAPEKVAKVECPNCGEMTERSHSRYEGPGPDKWACQPAPPEPAAPEMPEAVEAAIGFFRELEKQFSKPGSGQRYTAIICGQRADALETFWRTHAAQPVASSDAVAELVNVTERTINKLDRTWDQFFAPVRGAITTVRQQAAQPAAVGMTEELEHVLSIAERDLRYKEECFDNSARTVHDERIERLRAAIAAVREQCGRK